MVDYPIQTQESGLGNSPLSFDPDTVMEMSQFSKIIVILDC